LEDKSEIELLIVPNPHIQTPEYSISRVRDDEAELPENKQASYLLPTAPAVAEPALSASELKPQPEAAAVATLLPATSAPQSIQAAGADPAGRAAAAACGSA
jgi:ribonuclease E